MISKDDDSIYEPLSDMSLGALGMFVFLMLTLLILQRGVGSKKEYYQKEIQKLHSSISELQSKQSKGKKTEKESVSPPPLLGKVIKSEENRKKWIEVLRTMQELEKLENLRDIKKNTGLTEGVAHVTYKASPDSHFGKAEENIILDAIAFSPDEFHELLSSFHSSSSLRKRGTAFFAECTDASIPNWLESYFDKWGWDDVDIPLK
ncbi:MAG: hypothetical protein HQL32_16980 [Planctomycetes bacterium]|nr:hypothetical protein [Planctomycetota bacterium]